MYELGCISIKKTVTMSNQEINELPEDQVMDIPENQEGDIEIQIAMSLGSDYNRILEKDMDRSSEDEVEEDHILARRATCRRLLNDLMDEIDSDDHNLAYADSNDTFDNFIEQIAPCKPEEDLYNYEQYQRFWRDTNHVEMTEEDYSKYEVVVRSESAANSSL